ncbi:MAG: hypothetical protein ACI35R_05510 [Bacillus sp. (in: firmicutes)]
MQDKLSNQQQLLFHQPLQNHHPPNINKITMMIMNSAQLPPAPFPQHGTALGGIGGGGGAGGGNGQPYPYEAYPYPIQAPPSCFLLIKICN